MAQKRKRDSASARIPDSPSSASDAFPAADQLLDPKNRTSLIVLSDSSDSEDGPIVVAGGPSVSVPEPQLPLVQKIQSPVLEQGAHGASSSSFPTSNGSTSKRVRASEDSVGDIDVEFSLQRSFSQPERKSKQRGNAISRVLMHQESETTPIDKPPINNTDGQPPLPTAANFTFIPQRRPAKLIRATSAKTATEADVPGSERQSYLQIFDRILHTVLRAEAHLFSDQERQILSAFSELDRHSRYLFTRVYMRKREWIRVSSLNYGEKEVVEQSCKYLGAQRQNIEPFFLTDASITECEKALTLLLTPELRTLAKSKGIKQLSGKPKEALCSMIMKSAKQRTI
ncbi:hypothetical protein GGI22_001409, partial [Coemansia erecta]